MMPLGTHLTSLLLALGWIGCSLAQATQKPNIVFIFTDDQDLHHGSLDHMPALQELMMKQGTSFSNHYATVAVCCPSRVSLMRGQAAHNTNVTHVAAPGGGHAKWLASGQDDDYLPHWIRRSGYQAEYIGKIWNSHSLLNYSPPPKGWDHIDILLDPYTNSHNSVVMSQNGGRPRYYEGWQQSDVVRIKALERLRHLTKKERDPFFLMIAPTAPHVEPGARPPAPPSRYIDHYANLSLPSRPNFNPVDEQHHDRPSWWQDLPRLNQTQLAEIDLMYRRRSESLLGVDDIITDVVALLEEKGELDNTYLIFSTDQGYHLGSHRDVGKCSPYIEDANIPLVVRGPGVPANEVSQLRSTVIDFAPTFLDITGMAEDEWPSFFDGSSMLSGWRFPHDKGLGEANEAINVEFWGRHYAEIPTWADGQGGGHVYFFNTYKTMRIVGDNYAWVYSRWCTGDTELYDSKNDPYEMTNLADSTDVQIRRVMSRLNALLMVMKSCEGHVCRNPWSMLQPPPNAGSTSDIEEAPLSLRLISNFAQSLDPDYDNFFADIPTVTIAECEQYQYAPNEGPFYPPSAEFGLGMAHRNEPSFFEAPDVKPLARVPYIVGGSWEQRHATFEMLMADARVLTTKELAQDWNATTCNEGQTCTVDPRTLVHLEPVMEVVHTEL